jgi:enamine deaminase RidA (YjgF/YER057c/UK114 family)
MQQDLIAGDTLNFLTALADFPASAGWVLKFRLVPRTASNPAIALTAAAEGDDHRTSVTVAATAGWAADDYGWSSWVEKGAEVYSVESGQITVRPNPRTVAAGTDLRSVAERAFDQAQAALAAWTPTRRKYRIGDREMEFTSKADIVGVVHYWQGELAKERRAAALAKGLPDPRKSYVRINRE